MKDKNIWIVLLISSIVSIFVISIIIFSQIDIQTSKTITPKLNVVDEKYETIKYQCNDNTYVNNIIDCPKTKTIIKEIEVKPIKTPVVEEAFFENKATIGENNALSQALSYLKYTSFSYSGLVKQLEYEGYSHTEAVYGVDNCDANWNKQAALKAQSYLDYSAFSREGLINQLEFEGFTRRQAEYGVKAVGY